MSRFESPFLLTLTMVTAALVFGDVGGLARTVCAIGWLLFVPGLAITRLMQLDDLLGRLVIAVTVSMALDAAVSGILVYAALPSWDLAMSILLSISVAALIVDLAPAQPVSIPLPKVPGKLGEELRQARLIETLLDGGSLTEAADAAGVSLTTLRRSLHQSLALRLAVGVARGEELNEDVNGIGADRERQGRRSNMRVPQRRQ